MLITMNGFSQNMGIGTNTPAEKLEVNGRIKSTGVVLNNGGSIYDFLVKSNAAGEVGYKKGHGATGLNYIICIFGGFPSTSGSFTSPFLGEIRLFAGDFAPNGWAICNGQLMPINQYPSLFVVLQTRFGGDGQITFALPDLRGAAAVGSGISPAAYQWTLGQRSN
jgi:microcystin-dependent protein